jgi:hypothetical protein
MTISAFTLAPLCAALVLGAMPAPRYYEWTQTNVVVSQQGPCGNTIPVRITALLQPAP